MQSYYDVCDCRHFYTPAYNREILSRQDHINLLATPKGYRWYGPDGESLVRKRAYLGKSARKKEQPQPFPGFQQFMVELWSILTPEMLRTLLNILEEEFAMEPDEAIRFMIMQKIKAERLAEMEVLGPCRVSDDDIDWARTTASALASKMTQFTEMMATSRKTQRSAVLHRNLLQRMQKDFDLQPGEDTPLKKLVSRAAEGLAIWLSSIPGERNITNICTDLMSLYSPVTLE